MKLGVSSYSFKKYMAASGCDYIKICDLAKEFGFAGIEFTPLENVDDPMVAAREIKEHCDKIGLEAITVYAFSTENWKRPKDEVEKIMLLLERYLDRIMSRLSEFDIRIKFIGSKAELSNRLRAKIEKVEALTESRKRILNIALNYGSRAEITYAVNKLISEGKTNVTEEDIGRALYTSESPDPDLIVRTAGEQRLSNFLLWQAAYAEFYFTDTLWPDFGPSGVEEAINAYYKRTRRFGAVK